MRSARAEAFCRQVRRATSTRMGKSVGVIAYQTGYGEQAVHLIRQYLREQAGDITTIWETSLCARSEAGPASGNAKDATTIIWEAAGRQGVGEASNATELYN
jgi:hypothetical protein